MSSDALFLPFFSFVCPPKPHPPAFPLLLTSVLLVYSLHLQFNPFLGRGHSSPPPSLTGPLCVALYFIKLTSPPPALFVSASILLGSKQSPSWYVFLLLQSVFKSCRPFFESIFQVYTSSFLLSVLARTILGNVDFILKGFMFPKVFPLSVIIVDFILKGFMFPKVFPLNVIMFWVQP